MLRLSIFLFASFPLAIPGTSLNEDTNLLRSMELSSFEKYTQNNIVQQLDSLQKLKYNDDYNQTVLFYLYTRSSPTSPQQMWKGWGMEQNGYDVSKKTIILIHGYLDSLTTYFPQNFKDDALKNLDANIIAVDWSFFAMSMMYTWSANKVPDVGRAVGHFVEYLIDNGVPRSSVHIIGFSLGAHVAGFAGKTLNAKKLQIARISGLDAALPMFRTNSPSERLDANDAEFVDCIHTSAGVLGFDISICQADFYPNGGEYPQPGCSSSYFALCSHEKSYEYYAESFNQTHHFYAVTCQSINEGVPHYCTDEGAEMGYYASPKHLGDFYTQLGPSPPYAPNIAAAN